MNRLWKNSLRLLALLFVVYVSVPLFAQEPGNVDVHFSSEVAVPGHLIAPGDYHFRRITTTDPDTYEIVSADGSKFVGIFHVIPTERPNRGDTEVDLSAPDAAGVRMVQAWYGSGYQDGYEFTYSKKDIRRVDSLARNWAPANGSSAGL